MPSKMIHETFGGRGHTSGYRWTTLSKASLLLGAPDFLGGMPLLRHLPIKISEFLHKNHGDKFLSLQLPGSQIGLRLQQIDQLFEKIEKFDKDGTVIVLHGGGHDWAQGVSRLPASLCLFISTQKVSRLQPSGCCIHAT